MSAGVAIEASGVSKRFHIPGSRTTRSGEGRSAALRRRPPGRELEVLSDLDFEIRQGEFFGIVGRNGSGKSTLLRILAGVYRADGGRVRVAGRLAPILELGIGFNPELPAYDNVLLSSVMMGLSPREARRRYDEVIEFAGLEEYTDLKLKNYSSGMKVRLGFAVVINVDADVLLIDEVLAVGDVEFQERCGDVFGDMHRQGRTIVLVTHNMPTVSIHCERAMLIHEGRIERIGEPAEVVNRYLELNLRSSLGSGGDERGELFRSRFADTLADPKAVIDELHLTDAQGRRTQALGPREPMAVELTTTVKRELADPSITFRIDNEHGEIVFVAERERVGDAGRTLRPDERLRIRAELENRLTPGRYVLTAALSHPGEAGPGEPAGPLATTNFSVGGDPVDGIMRVDQSVSSEPIGAGE